jgi:hypothetical protein
MMPDTESRKPGEASERNQPDTRDRSRLHSAADQTRQEARQAGEKGAEAAKHTAQAAADVTWRTAEVVAEGREATMSGLRAIAGVQGPLADASFEQSRRVVETTARITYLYREAAERAAGDVHALFDAWTSLGRGLQDWQYAYFDALRQAVESVARRRQDFVRSNSPVQFAEVQRDLYVDLVSNTCRANATLLQLAGQITQNAVRPLMENAHAGA